MPSNTFLQEKETGIGTFRLEDLISPKIDYFYIQSFPRKVVTDGSSIDGSQKRIHGDISHHAIFF